WCFGILSAIRMELTNATIVRVPPALSAETVRNLRQALESAMLEGSSAVVVMVGEGAVFCRGLDVSGVDEVPRTAVEDFAVCLQVIRTGQKLVIALVQGAAIGGGVGLAAACDGVLATTEAVFMLPELLLGLTPSVILPYLAQRVSLQKL